MLSRRKFKLPPALIDNLISGFVELGVSAVRTKSTDEFFPDMDDIVFYEVALSKDDSFLVTGNIRHFPKKTFVVTPAQMVEILNRNGLLENID